jgi:curli biogenesis system outer membrane secretion channel CsgG
MWYRVLAVFLLLLTSRHVLEARPRLAVLPFRNPPGFDASCPLGAGLAEMIRQRLMAAGKVQIVNREDLQDMKRELNYAKDEFFDPATVPEKGGFQGSEFILNGKVLDFGHYSRDTGIGTLGRIAGGFQHTKTNAYVRLSIEVTDLKTGKLILSENYEGREQQKGAKILAGDIKSISDDLSNIKGGFIKIGTTEFNNSMLGKATHKAIALVIPRLIGLFKLEAKVLAVSPEGLVLDIGTSSGIHPGSRGKVFRVKEIRNQQGRVVWQSRTVAGAVAITDAKLDGSLARPEAAYEAHEGDVVVFDAP